ncbi:MAG: imidazole glycerol phosphate synthase subunit HisH [Thioalkalivibrionaceae bacterium]
MSRIAIIDYGLGNLASVKRAVGHVAPTGTDVVVTADAAMINSADRIIFPGQGAARDAMAALAQRGLLDLLSSWVDRPFLGLCLGLQILFERTAENGGVDLMGRFAGDVVRLQPSRTENPGEVVRGGRIKIPHMGWNRVESLGDHPLWAGVRSQEAWFYFVHSYHVRPLDADIVQGYAEHGQRFVAAVASGNLFAMQPHPEKSAETGLTVLRNFVHWNGR